MITNLIYEYSITLREFKFDFSPKIMFLEGFRWYFVRKLSFTVSKRFYKPNTTYLEPKMWFSTLQTHG